MTWPHQGLLLCATVLAVTSACSPTYRGGMLEPASGVFDDTADQGYRIFLRSAFFEGQPTYRCLQMVKERPMAEAVFAECPRASGSNEPVRLIHLREGAALSDAYSKSVPPAQVPPRVTSADLDAELFRRLEGVWWRMASMTGYPDHPRLVGDGTRFHFLTFRTGIGTRGGEITSPPAGSGPAHLAALGKLLGQYADAPASQHPRVREALLLEADALASVL